MTDSDKKEEKSSCTTPTSSRRSAWSRSNVEGKGTLRISSYFPVRKRGALDYPDVCGKRRRRGTTVSDVQFMSPVGAFNDVTPLRYRCVDDQDEQQAGDSQKSAAQKIMRTSTALGIFEELPCNLYHQMFDNLDITCLVALCLSSSTWNAQVLDYVQSNLFLQRVHRASGNFIKSESNFKKEY
ncbi:hypothetical protein COOONC_08189, partial [Cooperia oncophora]